MLHIVNDNPEVEKYLLAAVFDWRRSLENQQKDTCAEAMTKVKGFSKPTKSVTEGIVKR